MPALIILESPWQDGASAVVFADTAGAKQKAYTARRLRRVASRLVEDGELSLLNSTGCHERVMAHHRDAFVESDQSL